MEKLIQVLNSPEKDLKWSREIINIIKETRCIDNRSFISKLDMININAFAKIFNMNVCKNNGTVYLTKNGNMYIIQKTMQYKPFVRSNIYYRYRINKQHKTILNGLKTALDTLDFVDFIIPKGEQLSYDNKVQKYYYNHKEYGKCYFSTDILIRNDNINVYSVIITSVGGGHSINLNHFINDMNGYEVKQNIISELGSISLLPNNKEQLQLLYFKKIISKI